MTDVDRLYNFKFNKHLIVMVGNIGCGKSTYIKTIDSDYVTVCRDKLRYMFGNGKYVFHSQLEQIVKTTNQFIVDNLMSTGVNLVIDETNINKKKREFYISMSRIHNYKITATVCPRLSKQEAVDRRMNDPHGIPIREEWERVWDQFDSIYEEPIIEEGFNNIVYL